jgi:dihydropyrimidinase
VITIIKNGTVVSPSETFLADILIEDGKIKSIGSNLSFDGAEVIDAYGKYVLPGAVDVHTHFDLQSGMSRAVDDFYTGSIAAACGGTTTIVDHLAFGPRDCSLKHQIKEYHKLADRKAVIDYSFHGVIQHVNDSIFKEMEELVEEGISSFKVYLTYDFKLNDAEVLRVLEKMKELGGVTTVHAENHDVINHLRETFVKEGKTAPIYHAMSRPDACEAEAVERLIHLANLAGGAPLYIVHLSCDKSLKAVEHARENGNTNIFVETCTQYLTLTDEKYLGDNHEGLKYIMSPPLRKEEDCEALWKGIAENQIQVIGTDHCPFDFNNDKQLGKDNFTLCPNGAPGVEERVRVIFSEGVMKNRITINKFVEVMCTNPAKIFGLYPKKGILQPGSDGDIVIINPTEKEILTKSTMHSAVDYTTYEGMEVQGKIDMVMQRGEWLVKDNVFIGKKGQGEFLKRNL